jgi:uncharacterized membrane protein YkvA (DUF1232 family)
MALSSLRNRAKQLKRYVLVVYFVARDRRTPILVRLLALSVAAYALSPIDLIPDFIPIIGYLDDLLLIPLGVALVMHWVPPAVRESAQAKATATTDKPVSYVAAVIIVCVWIALCWALIKSNSWELLSEVFKQP